MTSLVEKVAREMAGYSVGPSLATKYLDIAKTATAIVLDAAAAKIRQDCPMCDDGVFDKGMTRDGPYAPFEFPEDHIECEYCGRPMAAIRALGDSHD